ncbi:MAG: TonB-dependent receptor [Polyangiales bacterium]
MLRFSGRIPLTLASLCLFFVLSSTNSVSAQPCDAEPECPQGERVIGECAEGDETCHPVSECGETIQCTSADPVIRPPSIAEFVEAAYPAAAQEEEREATVGMAVTIGLEGEVVDAEIVESAGDDFDGAALDAVRRFRFTPATRDGEPFTVRIRYNYVFELREPEVPAEPETPPPGRLEGQLLAQEDGNALNQAEVILTSEDESVARRAVTTADGRFAFEELPAGSYQLRIIVPDMGELTQSEDVLSGEVTDVTYRMQSDVGPEDEVDELAFGARAVIDPPPREVTRRSIPRDALTRIPGTRGDALRAIEILPGVARPPFGSGQLVIRGSAPGDSQVFIEGVPLPQIYHFGGLTSVINSRLLDRIDFFPGNFSARYGRKMGGIVEVDLRDPTRDGFHGVAELSVIDVSALVEFPIGENAAGAFGVRRSLIDLVIENVLPDDIGLVAAPVYYDYQAFITYRPTPNDRLRFLFYGANDRIAVNLGDSLGDDPNVRGNAGLTTRFNHLQLGWRHQFGADTRLDIDVLGALQQFQFGLGDVISFDLDNWQTSHRIELTHQASDRVRIIAGIDSSLSPFSIRYRGPQTGQQEGATEEPDLSDTPVDFTVSQTSYRPAVYFESDIRLTDPWNIILGGRVDYDQQIRRFNFDPRLVTAVQVHENVRIKGGAGMFSQPPEFQESSPELGNDNLDWIRAAHFGLGVDYDVVQGVRLSVEGFYKRLWDRVVATPGGSGDRFVNGGLGRIYGAEISARVSPEGRRWFGYLSYTVSRSERQDNPDQDQTWRLFDFDQTHIFTLTGVYRLPRNWEIGGTLRLVSGNPGTVPNGSIVNVNSLNYTALSSQQNTQRNPLFNRLDIRIEKKWIFDSWRLALFLDIQNVYNQQNQESLVFNYDFTQAVPVNGLPIIPAIGLRGEM